MYKSKIKNKFSDVCCGMWQAWKEKGQGLLTVRQPASADGGARAGPSQIVFTTESGRVLVNAALYKGVKVVPQARFPQPLCPRAPALASVSAPPHPAPEELCQSRASASQQLGSLLCSTAS